MPASIFAFRLATSSRAFASRSLPLSPRSARFSSTWAFASLPASRWSFACWLFRALARHLASVENRSGGAVPPLRSLAKAPAAAEQAGSWVLDRLLASLPLRAFWSGVDLLAAMSWCPLRRGRQSAGLVVLAGLAGGGCCGGSYSVPDVS